ncbi:hypothetical protein ERO13_D11G347200v2 [Gossypium hirsutum]|nr:hypothetical protein ERO13_D11G347200v2 [Gossypium hirsutum]
MEVVVVRLQDDALHWSRSFEVMEENLCRGNYRDQSSSRQLEIRSCWSHFQYIHGLAAHGVHYLHRPGPTLQDLGYFLLPELGQDKAYISEMVFTFVFLSFVLWTLHPFIFKSKKIYTVLIWCRVLAFLVASQILRIITFYSTQLPGPNYHCREGSKLARLPKPSNVQEVLLINFPQGVVYGCGDLIFSSHMIFTLVFVLTYQKYGTRRCIKQCAWLLAIIQSLLIVASRKHYTVDIAVAWYTVNLVVFFVNKKLPELLTEAMEIHPFCYH